MSLLGALLPKKRSVGYDEEEYLPRKKARLTLTVAQDDDTEMDELDELDELVSDGKDD